MPDRHVGAAAAPPLDRQGRARRREHHRTRFQVHTHVQIVSVKWEASDDLAGDGRLACAVDADERNASTDLRRRRRWRRIGRVGLAHRCSGPPSERTGAAAGITNRECRPNRSRRVGHWCPCAPAGMASGKESVVGPHLTRLRLRLRRSRPLSAREGPGCPADTDAARRRSALFRAPRPSLARGRPGTSR